MGVGRLGLFAVAACSFRTSNSAVDARDSAVVVPDAPPDAAPFAGIMHVQNKTAISSGTSMTVTLDQPVAAHDLLVGSFRGVGTVTVGDATNGAWTLVDSGANIWIYYVQNAMPSDAGLVISMTAQFNDDLRASVDEFSGVATTAALDQHSPGNAPNPGTTWQATAVQSNDGELVFAGGGTASSNIVFTPGATNGVAMTIGGQITNSNNGALFSEYALAAQQGTQDASTSEPANFGVYGFQATFHAGR